MKIIFALPLAILLTACAGGPQSGKSYLGTWKMRETIPGFYYLKIYSDGTVAQWPSPPDNQVAWTAINGNELIFGRLPPLRNPKVFRRGALLIMKSEESESIFDRVTPDIKPGEGTEQDAAANP